jgi:hypothetical protein
MSRYYVEEMVQADIFPGAPVKTRTTIYAYNALTRMWAPAEKGSDYIIDRLGKYYSPPNVGREEEEE